MLAASSSDIFSDDTNTEEAFSNAFSDALLLRSDSFRETALVSSSFLVALRLDCFNKAPAGFDVRGVSPTNDPGVFILTKVGVRP